MIVTKPRIIGRYGLKNKDWIVEFALSTLKMAFNIVINMNPIKKHTPPKKNTLKSKSILCCNLIGQLVFYRPSIVTSFLIG
jgi:hypothetical protein